MSNFTMSNCRKFQKCREVCSGKKKHAVTGGQCRLSFCVTTFFFSVEKVGPYSATRPYHHLIVAISRGASWEIFSGGTGRFLTGHCRSVLYVVQPTVWIRTQLA